jgi:hypothetical protein
MQGGALKSTIAETVITSLENVADYQVFEATIYAGYQARTRSGRLNAAASAQLRLGGRLQST